MKSPLHIRAYVILAVVFLGSLVTTWFLQSSGIWRDLAAMPAVLALIGALYQLMRDEARYVREETLQHDRQRFELGATSHMADVAFDKLVAFCEEYVAELHVTLRNLYREGESPIALEHANRLLDIQRKHSLWITPDIEAYLSKFDSALRRLGAAALLHRRAPEVAAGGGRLEEMFDLLADVLGLARVSGEPADKEVAITTILERTREALGVSQLVALRRRLLELRQFPEVKR